MWVKKGDNPLFYVTTGSYIEAELYELDSLYFLDRLSTAIDEKSVGLHGEDGLVAINITNGLKFERLGKILLHYSRKYFQSLSKQISSKLIFLILPSTLRQRDTFFFQNNFLK